MRCRECDVMLTDFEATRMDEDSGEYMDLCNDCFKPISSYVKVKERNDLLHKKDLQDLDIEDKDD